MRDFNGSVRPKRVKALILAEAANPEWVSVPLVGWKHAKALIEHEGVDAHLVTHVRNRDAIVRAGLVEGADFTAIDSEALAARMYQLAERLRGGSNKGWTTLTAMQIPSYYYYEYLVWKQFGPALRRKEYDVVHRITPLSPAMPSVIGPWLDRAGVPYVVGPLNGGLPWPKEFASRRLEEGEWLSYMRKAMRLMPGYGATRRYASALVVASRATLNEVPKRYRDKCVYLPENGVDPASIAQSRRGPPGRPLRVVFVGRLVPCKGIDLLLEAAAPLCRAGRVHVDIIGDGSVREDLEAQIESLGIGEWVTMHGWVEHEQVHAHMAHADILGFPSVHEFGGGAVLEAMSLGIVPLIVDYGGPAELVTPATGMAVPLGTHAQVVAGLAAKLQGVVDDPGSLVAMSDACRERIRRLYTWDVKARQSVAIYRWVMGDGVKPHFGNPLSADATERIIEPVDVTCRDPGRGIGTGSRG